MKEPFLTELAQYDVVKLDLDEVKLALDTED